MEAAKIDPLAEDPEHELILVDFVTKQIVCQPEFFTDEELQLLEQSSVHSQFQAYQYWQKQTKFAKLVDQGFHEEELDEADRELLLIWLNKYFNNCEISDTIYEQVIDEVKQAKATKPSELAGKSGFLTLIDDETDHWYKMTYQKLARFKVYSLKTLWFDIMAEYPGALKLLLWHYLIICLRMVRLEHEQSEPIAANEPTAAAEKPTPRGQRPLPCIILTDIPILPPRPKPGSWRARLKRWFQSL